MWFIPMSSPKPHRVHRFCGSTQEIPASRNEHGCRCCIIFLILFCFLGCLQFCFSLSSLPSGPQAFPLVIKNPLKTEGLLTAQQPIMAVPNFPSFTVIGIFTFFFFFFFCCPPSMWELLGQKWNPRHSCDLRASASAMWDPLTHCATVGTPYFLTLFICLPEFFHLKDFVRQCC